MVSKTYYNTLINNLLRYSKEYYENNNSLISDADFDSLFVEAKNIEAKHPEWLRKDSPTINVMGKASSGLPEVKHDPAMLSLGKAMDFNELFAWLKSAKANGAKKLFCECKHDGLACKLVYKNGKFVQAATRGDGHVGEDVTITCTYIPSIPKMIDNKDEYFEVRGEVFLTKSGMAEINKVNVKQFKNVRNAASGILRKLEPDENEAKHLVFSAYMLPYDKQHMTHSESMEYLGRLGFKRTNNFVKNISIDMNLNYEDIIHDLFVETNSARDNMDFDIDGMVLKIDDYDLQHELGEKRSVPNWAIAYKFPQQEKLTILKSVEWLLGSKGNITPLAHIGTVNIFGADVSAATLHNCKEIERLDVKIGDHVIVTRRGDVIPKIIGVSKDMRDGTEKSIAIPTHCPVCGSPVVNNGVFIRCDNESCVGRLSGRVENLVKALDIKNFGGKVIDKLIEENKLKSPADIFKLVADDISSLDRMGTKSAEKIITNINKARNASLDLVIAGLTIPGVGVAAGKDLANKYKTLDKFKDAEFNDLVTMNDIGETTATNIIDWLDNNSSYVDDLIHYNIATEVQEFTTTTDKLSASVFAFTGKLSISRKEMEANIVDNGGTVSSINKTINYLIIGDNAVQTKIDKAKKYGAQIISESEFMKMLN